MKRRQRKSEASRVVIGMLKAVDGPSAGVAGHFDRFVELDFEVDDALETLDRVWDNFFQYGKS